MVKWKLDNVLGYALTSSFLYSGGRMIRISGQNLDVVQEPKMRVTLSPPDTLPPRKRRSITKRHEGRVRGGQDHGGLPKRWRRIVPEKDCPEGKLCHVKQVCVLQTDRCALRLITLVFIRLLFLYFPPVRVSLHSEQLLSHLVSNTVGWSRSQEGEGQSPLPAGQPPFWLQHCGEWSFQLWVQPKALPTKPERPQHPIPPQTRQHHLCWGGT